MSEPEPQTVPPAEMSREEKKRAQKRAEKRRYKARHPDKIRDEKRRYYLKHREEILERRRMERAAKSKRIENTPEWKEADAKWRADVKAAIRGTCIPLCGAFANPEPSYFEKERRKRGK